MLLIRKTVTHYIKIYVVIVTFSWLSYNCQFGWAERAGTDAPPLSLPLSCPPQRGVPSPPPPLPQLGVYRYPFLHSWVYRHRPSPTERTAGCTVAYRLCTAVRRGDPAVWPRGGPSGSAAAKSRQSRRCRVPKGDPRRWGRVDQCSGRVRSDTLRTDNGERPRSPEQGPPQGDRRPATGLVWMGAGLGLEKRGGTHPTPVRDRYRWEAVRYRWDAAAASRSVAIWRFRITGPGERRDWGGDHPRLVCVWRGRRPQIFAALEAMKTGRPRRPNKEHDGRVGEIDPQKSAVPSPV